MLSGECDWRGAAPNDTVNRYSRGGFVICDPSVRRLRQVQFFVAFGCGVWLIVLAKGDDFNLWFVVFVVGIYPCSKMLLLSCFKGRL